MFSNYNAKIYKGTGDRYMKEKEEIFICVYCLKPLPKWLHVIHSLCAWRLTR